MSFDRNDPVQLQALHDELVNDPIAMGYGGIDTYHGVLIPLLTDAANNVNADVGVPPLSIDLFLNAVAGEALNAANQNFTLLLLEPAGGYDDDLSRFRDAISGMNDVGLNNSIAAVTRPLSRADVLFGGIDANGSNEFVSISAQDIGAARGLS